MDTEWWRISGSTSGEGGVVDAPTARWSGRGELLCESADDDI
jgi:hypothetical protein